MRHEVIVYNPLLAAFLDQPMLVIYMIGSVIGPIVLYIYLNILFEDFFYMRKKKLLNWISFAISATVFYQMLFGRFNEFVLPYIVR